jgi:hypothetical protein
MKITQHKTVTHGSCLPPEAYIHLWNAAATDTKLRVQKIKSTYIPKK